MQGLKLYDVKAVARFLDVSERRVRQLRDEKVIAEVRPGLYDLIETRRAKRRLTTTPNAPCWCGQSGKMKNTNCS